MSQQAGSIIKLEGVSRSPPVKFVKVDNPNNTREYTKKQDWELLREFILELHEAGYNNPSIRKKLQRVHGVTVSARQLKHRLDTWKKEMPQRKLRSPSTKPSSPSVPETGAMCTSSKPKVPKSMVSVWDTQSSDTSTSSGSSMEMTIDDSVTSVSSEDFEVMSPTVKMEDLGTPEIEMIIRESDELERSAHCTFSKLGGPLVLVSKAQEPGSPNDDIDEALYQKVVESLQDFTLDDGTVDEEDITATLVRTVRRVEYTLSMILEMMRSPESIRIRQLTDSPTTVVFERDQPCECRKCGTDSEAGKEPRYVEIGRLSDIRVESDGAALDTLWFGSRASYANYDIVSFLESILAVIVSDALFFPRNHQVRVSILYDLAFRARQRGMETIFEHVTKILVIFSTLIGDPQQGGVQHLYIVETTFYDAKGYPQLYAEFQEGRRLLQRYYPYVNDNKSKGLDLPFRAGIAVYYALDIVEEVIDTPSKRNCACCQKKAMDALNMAWDVLNNGLIREPRYWTHYAVLTAIGDFVIACRSLKYNFLTERSFDGLIRSFNSVATGNLAQEGNILDGVRLIGALMRLVGSYRSAIIYTQQCIELLKQTSSRLDPFHLKKMHFSTILIGEVMIERGAIRYAEPTLRWLNVEIKRFQGRLCFELISKDQLEKSWNLYQHCVTYNNSNDSAMTVPQYESNRIFELEDTSDSDIEAMNTDERNEEESTAMSTELVHPQPRRYREPTPVDFSDPGFQMFMADVISHADPVGYYTTFRDTPSPNLTIRR
ncbi:hypothetical protein H072_6472 [Dactylellina haptotyla CBS 200.50]|uniref:Clr5 domain-containing protein n=1 Tax=Dactylellina haptotyla (strain CBS 200.50) TaxID=1284197 RepID=S8AF05_DACHA|nr:hypothetical protein H072_6472 [Dactylellina haptotyla CBS 200.50]